MRTRNICCYSLILVFLLVTAFNIFMLRSIYQPAPSNVWENERSVLFSRLPSDKTGQYKIWTLFKDSISRDEILDNSEKDSVDITIITQTSASNLLDLVEMSEQWNGQISVGVFVPGEDIETALEYITTMKICMSKLKSSIIFHLVLALSHPPMHDNLAYYVRKTESHPRVCGGSIDQDSKKSKKNYANERVSYPVNVLRNVALDAAKTSHVLVIDIDMLPTPNLRHDFKKNFKAISRDNGVYVLPTFELKEKHEVPRTKEELVKAWDSGSARPFYQEVCWKCQRYTEYDLWKRSNAKELSVAYKVDWQDPWEPFFIAEKKNIHYDERFKQYGFNRISQVCETHFSGHDFFVLDNAFLVHRGFKENKGFHQSKDIENARNRILFRNFKRELKQKYPNSNRHC